MRYEPRIVDRSTHGEVIEALMTEVVQAEQLVHGIIEETPDAGSPKPGLLGLEIKDLANHAAFPKQPRIKPCPPALERPGKFSQHTHAEAAIGGDGLLTGDPPRRISHIAFLQKVKCELGWAARRPGPYEFGTQCGSEHGNMPVIPNQGVKARSQPKDPMDEEDQMNMRWPRPNQPRGAARQRGP